MGPPNEKIIMFLHIVYYMLPLRFLSNNKVSSLSLLYATPTPTVTFCDTVRFFSLRLLNGLSVPYRERDVAPW